MFRVLSRALVREGRFFVGCKLMKQTPNVNILPGIRLISNTGGLQPGYDNFQNVVIEASVPNHSWSTEMVTQYEKYMALVKEGGWTKIPSHFDSTKTNRLFPRAFPPTGDWFEYALFKNDIEKTLHVLLQFGPFLEGRDTFAHGGAISTVYDVAMVVLLHQLGRKTVTVNLNVDFKRAVQIGTACIVEAKYEGRDGRKVYTSATMRSFDGSIIYGKSTAIFFDYIPLDDSSPQ